MVEPDNVVLEYLRRIDRRLENVEQKLGNLVGRVGSLEDQFVIMRGDVARIEHRMDQNGKAAGTYRAPARPH